jgi:ATP-binding cassette subfamily C (CFTR/MRP) protein 4
MIHGLVRSPSFFFDITPTGRLNNKFSNDLGILDNMLMFVLTDAVEGTIICIVLLINVFSINLYFIIPGVITIIFVILFFMYCKKAIVNIKQLDLRLKSPVFNMVGEMINGLVQIKIFNRRYTLLK